MKILIYYISKVERDKKNLEENEENEEVVYGQYIVQNKRSL